MTKKSSHASRAHARRARGEGGSARRAPHAGWTHNQLLRSAANAGWGELGARGMQGVRSTLRALGDLLDDSTGQGMVTAPQIADAAGLSPDWVRTRLVILEDAGIITWTRGGVVRGKPTPSAIRISRRALVALILRGRTMLAERRAERAAATTARIADLRYVMDKSNPGQHRRRSDHPALSRSLSLLTGRSTSSSPVDDASCRHDRPGGRLLTTAGTPRCPECRLEEGLLVRHG